MIILLIQRPLYSDYLRPFDLGPFDLGPFDLGPFDLGPFDLGPFAKSRLEMKVTVVGLGKLGAPIAVVLADSGFEVVGVDLRQSVVDDVNKQISHLNEPGYSEILKSCEGRLIATTDLHSAASHGEAIFIIVPTPTCPSGGFSNQYIESVLSTLSGSIRGSKTFKLIVIVSTVMPNSCFTSFIPQLEALTGKKIGVGFGLCYSPEFIALGQVIRDLQHPDFVLIGESDPRSGDILQNIYRQTYVDTVEIRRMNLTNAELAKIAVNTFVTTKIAYANMLGELCEHLPNADAAVVTSAIGLDSRIGTKYLRPGLPYGGPCFPRDNAALANLAESLGADARIPKATHLTNESQMERMIAQIQRYVEPTSTVGILGLAYKADSEVIEHAFGYKLAHTLATHGTRVIAYDRLVSDLTQTADLEKLSYATSAIQCVRSSDIIVVATSDAEFRQIPIDNFGKKKCILFDSWRIFADQQLPESCRYVTPGRYVEP